MVLGGCTKCGVHERVVTNSSTNWPCTKAFSRAQVFDITGTEEGRHGPLIACLASTEMARAFVFTVDVSISPQLNRYVFLSRTGESESIFM